MGHVERRGIREMDTDFGLENLNKTKSKGNLPVEGMTILKWTLRKQSRRMWNGFMDFTTGLLVGCCVHGNEHKISMNSGELLQQMRTISFSSSSNKHTRHTQPS